MLCLDTAVSCLAIQGSPASRYERSTNQKEAAKSTWRGAMVFPAQKTESTRFKSYKMMASTSQETENVEMTEGRFSEEHFTPILSSDEEDYDDYTEKDVEEFPELDFTDEQLNQAVSKLSKPDYEQYVQLRDQYLK